MIDWWILMCNQIVIGLVVLQQNIWPLWPSHRTVCTAIRKVINFLTPQHPRYLKKILHHFFLVINFFNSTTSTLSQKVPPLPLLPSLLKFSCKFNDKKV